MAAPDLAFIGFGEAAQAFAGGIADQFGRPLRGYDRIATPEKQAEFAAHHVVACDSNAAAIAGANLILSVVTADQALAAAEETAEGIRPTALFCDCNSVAPDTKRAAARAIEASGGRYVDVAVMAPVHPKRLAVPLLLAGPHAEEAAEALRAVGFTSVRALGGAVGRASSIKMIRSVMVKGIEALSAECALAAEAAGVRAEVLASLDASWREESWETRFDYNLDRMMLHGLRRAAEMEEVVATLESLGTGAAMTRGTVQRQRAIGSLGLKAPPEGLQHKLDSLRASFADSPGEEQPA